MTNIEIKKALYKQKPIADLIHKEEDYIYYECSLDCGTVIYFKIPKEETVDADGNYIFSESEPAQLLIRWLK